MKADELVRACCACCACLVLVPHITVLGLQVCCDVLRSSFILCCCLDPPPSPTTHQHTHAYTPPPRNNPPLSSPTSSIPIHTQDLDFSTVVAPKAEAVFDELADVLAPYYMGANAPLAAEEDSDTEGEGTDGEGDGNVSAAAAARAAGGGGVFARLGPALEQLQKYVAKAALLLWLWFDQQCEVMAEQVSVRERWEGWAAASAWGREMDC